jgi:hypothetical protein
MTDDSSSQDEPQGPSRRRVLVGAGVGTVLAWAAPVVAQVQVAHAAGSPPPVESTCVDGVLSGGPNPAETIGVDDDITVYLNGAIVFTENDDFAQETPPIHLGPITNGDLIRVTANDSAIFGGNRQIEPIYLHCPATGATQVLDAVGFHDPGPYPPSDTVFYDRTFTVAL